MADFNDSLESLRAFFDSGATLPYEFRKNQLELLGKAILKYEQQINEALYTDLKKSKEEVWLSESGLLMSEIKTALKHLHQWMRPQKVSPALVTLPSTAKIYHDPLGVVLIIAPWNYPLQLLLSPLVGAIAAGNCAVLKPSELAGATEQIIATIINEIFPEHYVKIIHGEGREVIPRIMQDFSFDHIFFTGSVAVGREIYQLAAKRLTPVTLELGGKSPSIVYEDADIRVAAKRIVSGKFLNTGQTCIAPDYVLVQQGVKERLLKELKGAIEQFYGRDPSSSSDYGKIINTSRFMRLERLLEDGAIYYGGTRDAASLYMGPVILSDVSMEDAVMQEEIFGPILPVISFSTTPEAMDKVRQNKNPLALYLFTRSQEIQQEWLNKVPFGGGCINDTTLHFVNKKLPFGGVGNSGIGAYHGRRTFEVFSHEKAVLRSSTRVDPSLRYPPMKGKLPWFKRLLR